MNFLFDQRYFPFESTGAVSYWRLEFPKEANEIDISNIKDIFIALKYTASQGGEKFKEDVLKEVEKLK